MRSRYIVNAASIVRKKYPDKSSETSRNQYDYNARPNTRERRKAQINDQLFKEMDTVVTADAGFISCVASD